MVLGKLAIKCKRMKPEHSLTPYTKINLKWIEDLTVKPETMKFLEKNNFIGKTNYTTFTRCIFLNFNMSLLFKKIFLNLIYPY